MTTKLTKKSRLYSLIKEEVKKCLHELEIWDEEEPADAPPGFKDFGRRFSDEGEIGFPKLTSLYGSSEEGPSGGEGSTEGGEQLAFDFDEMDDVDLDREAEAEDYETAGTKYPNV